MFEAKKYGNREPQAELMERPVPSHLLRGYRHFHTAGAVFHVLCVHRPSPLLTVHSWNGVVVRYRYGEFGPGIGTV